MNVTVKAFADFRELLGTHLLVSVEEGATVGDLLCILGKGSPSFSSRVLENNGQLNQGIIVLQNGRNVQSLDKTGTRLAEGDIIAIFPPVAGG